MGGLGARRVGTEGCLPVCPSGWLEVFPSSQEEREPPRPRCPLPVRGPTAGGAAPGAPGGLGCHSEPFGAFCWGYVGL